MPTSGTQTLVSLYASWIRCTLHHILSRGSRLEFVASDSSLSFCRYVHKEWCSPVFSEAPSVTMDVVWLKMFCQVVPHLAVATWTLCTDLRCLFCRSPLGPCIRFLYHQLTSLCLPSHVYCLYVAYQRRRRLSKISPRRLVCDLRRFSDQ